MEDNNLSQWGFPALVALAGAVLGYAHKGGEKKSARTVLLSLATSMFVAFVTYGLASFWVEKEIVKAAAAGLMSYMSTNTIVVFEEIIIRAICKKLGIEVPDRRKEGDKAKTESKEDDNVDS